MVIKVLRWGAIVLLVLFVAWKPSAAAQVFKSIGGGIVDIAGAFGDFFHELVS
jgi:hypothetical protein